VEYALSLGYKVDVLCDDGFSEEDVISMTKLVQKYKLTESTPCKTTTSTPPCGTVLEHLMELIFYMLFDVFSFRFVSDFVLCVLVVTCSASFSIECKALVLPTNGI
jgi:hypothetical protein